ncbi:MAG: hypothetical protein MUE44_29740 [Oscillatoriaceae cyanobacterium Prado104]|nr:hypothetical protein [Oscillatoriaceae cyanobacterium Prado104]
MNHKEGRRKKEVVFVGWVERSETQQKLMFGGVKRRFRSSTQPTMIIDRAKQISIFTWIFWLG